MARPNGVRKRNKKKRLIAQRGPACVYCYKIFTYQKLTMDHVVPHALGGGNADTNIVLACSPCNHSRGLRMEADIRAMKRKLIENVLDRFYDPKPLSRKLLEV